MVYAAAMRFSQEDLAVLEATPEVEIETVASDGRTHRTVIWVVVDGSDVFIRSYRGASARWYREACERPEVAIHVDGRRIPATAASARDADAVRRTSQGLARKYPTDPATPAMLRDEVLDTTLRLDAA